jgi:peptidoglycan/xylan/chitin deacetylase (PgdA/CDA1 family)
VARIALPRAVVAWDCGGGYGLGPRRVALTFDDGPDHLTREYLEVLAQFGARSTFFLVGRQCEAHPELVDAIVRAGHEVAPHGYTHRPFPTLTTEELRDELARTAALLPQGDAKRRLVRPPYGAVSLASLVTCAREGFTTALWSKDSGDARPMSAEEISAAFARDEPLEDGTVVLLHEGQRSTLDALPSLLMKLTETGHCFVPMGELLEQ